MNPVYFKNVSTLLLDKEKCTLCGMCVIVCPHGVFELSDESAEIVNKDYCMECGACKINCPESAIYVKSGVGCATAMILSAITGKEISCGDDEDSNEKCCG